MASASLSRRLFLRHASVALPAAAVPVTVAIAAPSHPMLDKLAELRTRYLALKERQDEIYRFINPTRGNIGDRGSRERREAVSHELNEVGWDLAEVMNAIVKVATA